MPKDKNPGYHLADIPKGVLGDISKIIEEAKELEDAHNQGAEIMVLIELADLIGAIRLYLSTHHPSIKLSDLMTMADITERAFKAGHRK